MPCSILRRASNFSVVDIFSVPNIYFIVTLTEIGPLGFHTSGESLWPLSNDQAEKFTQYINIVIRTTMLTSGCRSFGKARTCYLPEGMQDELQGGRHHSKRQVL